MNNAKVVQQNAGSLFDKWNFQVIIKLLHVVTSQSWWMPEREMWVGKKVLDLGAESVCELNDLVC